MAITEVLRDYLIKEGAAMVGFADLEEISYENRKGFKYGISIIVPLDPRIVLQIEGGPTKEYYEEYTNVNKKLDSLAVKASEFLLNSGYDAFPQISSNVVQNPETLRTILPHKTVATLSGIGWVGKCALIVTKKYGSAIRMTSVLTNAPLEVGTPIRYSQCGSCSICESVCPGNAVLGRNWSYDLDRDSFFDAFACRKTAKERTARIGLQASMCGLCMHSCPYTQRYLKSNL